MKKTELLGLIETIRDQTLYLASDRPVRLMRRLLDIRKVSRSLLELLAEPVSDEHLSGNLIAHQFAREGGAERVHSVWATMMSYQGREIAPERQEWETLPDRDKRMDHLLAANLTLSFLDWMTDELAERETQLPLDIPPDPDRGLYPKYLLYHRDGRPVADRFRFVLSPETDPAAYSALIEYASLTRNDKLQKDLFDWIEKHKSPSWEEEKTDGK